MSYELWQYGRVVVDRFDSLDDALYALWRRFEPTSIVPLAEFCEGFVIQDSLDRQFGALGEDDLAVALAAYIKELLSQPHAGLMDDQIPPLVRQGADR